MCHFVYLYNKPKVHWGEIHFHFACIWDDELECLCGLLDFVKGIVCCFGYTQESQGLGENECNFMSFDEIINSYVKGEV